MFHPKKSIRRVPAPLLWRGARWGTLEPTTHHDKDNDWKVKKCISKSKEEAVSTRLAQIFQSILCQIRFGAANKTGR